VHMVTAADGAEKYYTQQNNKTRSEGIQAAISQDEITRKAWMGHPYFDVIDNMECDTFDDKLLKLLQVVCDRAGIEYRDRLAKNSRKRKWLVTSFDPAHFGAYEEFEVFHDYLKSDDPKFQVRIRKRGQKGHWSYTITTRHALLENEPPVETRMPVSKREYERYRQMRDPQRVTLCKRRRCFNFGSQYFHLDIYVRPLPPSCGGKPLTFLETYTTSQQGDATEPRLPEFIIVDREITGDPAYSMFNLSKMKAAASALHNGRHNDNNTPPS